MKKLVIGDVTLENNMILAPMAGVTDLPFRLLCKEQGAGFIYTEMVSAKGIYYNNKNTEIIKIDYVNMTYVGTSLKDFSKMFDEQEAEGKPRELTAVCRFCNSEYTFVEKDLIKKEKKTQEMKEILQR